MTYSISPATYRLGYSVSWNSINSSLFFSRSVRLNIVLNTFLKGLLKYFRIKLVKWVSHSEGNYYKLVLVVLDTTYPEFYKIRFKSKRLKFFAWNYLYYNKVTWKVVQLRDFYTVKDYKPKARLGSGKFWHKFYKSLFFSLGKKFLHSRKLVKNGNIDFEFNNWREENSPILKLRSFSAFNKTKFGWDPKYQFAFKFYFKLYLYLKKWLIIKAANLSDKTIKLNFFIKLFLFNFFLSKLVHKSKNEKLRKFYSRFINVNKAYYKLSKRIVPDNNFYFDSFNYIKGANYRWLGSGRISQNRKLRLVTPWSNSFLKGFLFNKSYKKIARRLVLGAFEEDKSSERIRLANFMIKNFVIWKKPVIDSNLYVQKSALFFNSDAFNMAAVRLKNLNHNSRKRSTRKKKKIKYSRFFQMYNIYQDASRFMSMQKRVKRKYVKTTISNKLVINSLVSNRYYYNVVEDAYMNKVGFFKTQLKILKQIRLRFLKRVKMNSFSRFLVKSNEYLLRSNLSARNQLKIIYKFGTFYWFLTNNFFLRRRRFNKLKVRPVGEIKERISFFRNKKKIFFKHNPFGVLPNNFLLMLYNLNFFSTLEKRKKKKKIIKDFWDFKSNLNLRNVDSNLSKFYFFVTYQNLLLTVNLFLRKYNYLLRLQRSVLLFRFYWSLEFYKLYFTFNLRRWNFEKVFKNSLSNFLVKKKFKSQNAAFFKNLQRPRSARFSVAFGDEKNNLYFFRLKLLYGVMEVKFSKFFINNAINLCLHARTKNNFLHESLALYLKKKRFTSSKSVLFSSLLFKFIKAFSFFFKVRKKNFVELYSPTGEEPPLFFKDKYLIKSERKKRKEFFLVKASKRRKKSRRWSKFSFFLMAALFKLIIKKKVKNSFILYKFNIFFSKPLIVTMAKKIFQKNLAFSSLSLKKNWPLVKIFQKNIFTTTKNKFRISRKRLWLSRVIEKKARPLKTPKTSLLEFMAVKKKLYPLFLKNVHLKYHRKFRHVWRNLNNYSKSATFFRRSLFLENWFIWKYTYYISLFFFETALKIRLIALSAPSKDFKLSTKLYLHRSLRVLRSKNISGSEILINAKSKVLIRFIQFLQSTSNHFVKKNKFLFSFEIKNSNLFFSKRSKFINKVTDFKKVVADVVDKSAKFRPYRPPTARNKWWQKRQNQNRKFKAPIFFYEPNQFQLRRDVFQPKRYHRKFFSDHFFNIFNVTKSQLYAKKLLFFNFKRIVRHKNIFYHYWLNKMLLRKTELPFTLAEKSPVEFEQNVLQSFFCRWHSEKYDHHNRHRKYFSPTFLNSLGIYTKKLVSNKLNQSFLRAFPRRFIAVLDLSHSFDIFIRSIKRYTKNLNLSLLEINKHLEEGRLKYLRFKSMRQKKKNFPLRSRNRWLGRKNYLKYSRANFKEIKFEKNREKKNRVKLKQRKFVYSYYRLQRNLNKQLIKMQPKLFAKHLFNPKIWFTRKQNLKKLKLVLFFKEISRIANRFSLYRKVDWLGYQKKLNESFFCLNYKALSFNFILLNFFKKSVPWSPIWKIYKTLYSAKFYLYRFSAKRIYSKQRNSYRVNMPFRNNFFTRSRQYKHTYLNRAEFGYMSNNRFFNKFRKTWTKNFFTKQDHFKIFYLYSKKIYYSFCLSQNVNIEFLKAFFLKKIKIMKFKINSRKLHLKISAKQAKKAVCLFHFFLKNYVLLKLQTSSFDFFLKFLFSNLLMFPAIDKKLTKESDFIFSNFSMKVLNKTVKNLPFNVYIKWFKLFSLRANKFLVFLPFKSIFNTENLSRIDYAASSSNSVFKRKPWSVLYFGKFFRFFYTLPLPELYFSIFNYNKLKRYEEFAILIEFTLRYIYNFFTNLKNSKKILLIFRAVITLKRSKLKHLIKFSCKKFSLVYSSSTKWSKAIYYYYYSICFINHVNKFFSRTRHLYHFNQNYYSTRYWIKNKKFLFWMEQNLEKALRMNIKLDYINSVKAISKFYRGSTNFFLYTKRLKLYRLEGGWRQQTIYADVLWVILIAIKYYSSSFLSNMISEQIVKRKKQWPFIKILKTTITGILPKNLINDPARVDGLKISINGKINGRDRSIHYMISKLYKDLQHTKVHPIFVKIDYSLSFANSKYGIFGIKVWLSRI